MKIRGKHLSVLAFNGERRDYLNFDLNAVLGNSDGSFVWGGAGFVDSIEEGHGADIRDGWLIAKLRKPTPGWVRHDPDWTYLPDLIRVDGGKLIGPRMRLLDGASIPVPKVSLVIIIYRVCLTGLYRNTGKRRTPQCAGGGKKLEST
jgi:hypothetical protein